MDEMMKNLIEAMQAGDEDAFDQLYQLYAGRLYRTAYLISGNKEDSEDILQETFVQCFLHRKDIKSPEAFPAWLMKIMVRISWRVVKQRKATVSADAMLEHEEYAGMAQALFADNQTPTPLDQVISSEDQKRIIAAVNHLDHKLRTVVILYYYDNFSVKEIAELTGSFEGTVKSRLHTARTQLKKQLKGAGYSDHSVGRVTG